MKAIIIAAGRGSRLSPLTDVLPKCMLTVGGRPLLHHAVSHLQAVGINDILVVRGYAAGQIHCPGVRFADNPIWSSTNVLGSIFTAPHEITGELLIVYSDIIFRRHVVESAVAAKGHIVPVVDTDWREAYVNRSLHPISEAEKVSFGEHGRISRIGKSNVADIDADGEFIGMIKLGTIGSAQLVHAYMDAKSSLAGRPFGSAASFEQAYLTDILQSLIEGGEAIHPAKIKGGWREIDTVEDLEAAQSWHASSI